MSRTLDVDDAMTAMEVWQEHLSKWPQRLCPGASVQQQQQQCLTCRGQAAALLTETDYSSRFC